jgi:glycosyltransferase involved in cell wall biosynthesis
MMKQGMLSLILPVRDGAQHLATAVTEALAVLSRHAASYELIIIDDGSRDSTGTVADRLAARHAPVLVTHQPQPIGFGRALRDGWRLAQGAQIIAADLGGLGSLADLGRMLALSESYPVVLGTRLGRRAAALSRIASAAASLELHDPAHRFALLGSQLADTLSLEDLGGLAHVQLFLRARALGLPTLQLELRNLAGRSAGYGSPTAHDLLQLSLNARPGAPSWPTQAVIGAGIAAAAGGAWLLRRSAGEHESNPKP